MSVLHINSSARMNQSNTRIIGQYLVDALGEPVVSRDLAQHTLPPITAEDLIAVHGSSDSQRDSLQPQLALSDQLIEELRAADNLVLGAPMYNFGIPASLKQWIDAICRAGVSFKYTEQGPVGLLNVRRAFIITATGGTPVGSEMDFASRYLEHICKFLGISEVFHIVASGSKGTPEQVIAQGKEQVDTLIAGLHSNAAAGAA
ncbi:ACP phosphodiesterase [Halieaceae bacterium IMCC14734]|uniref:FMN dependent NADH:quinone oxidoreductase n=1 Tax=Candidatus Litorirhabdus singularis TaxID=2518993 RepID=A0ABT3TGB1_9GAMM|nr:NAD(P)H-dependent oxidoreductase [Candidatus Litorirhabdus singularis]MCX2980806.1 ACP phosphodiesterase [Candidatus Litorirhabdus singularis]